MTDPELLLAFGFDEFQAGKVPVSRHLLIAYDELYAIKFLGRKLLPYWRRDGATPGDLLRAAERDYESLARRCAEFDTELMADLTRAGGAALRADGGACLSPGAGRLRPGGRRQQTAACSFPRKTAATAASPRST